MHITFPEWPNCQPPADTWTPADQLISAELAKERIALKVALWKTLGTKLFPPHSTPTHGLVTMARSLNLLPLDTIRTEV